MLKSRADRIISDGHRIIGTVKSVKACGWLKVNTKPIRTHSLDGALFLHKITYEYSVNNKMYCGKCILSPYKEPPGVGTEIVVYYDKSRPEISKAVV